MLQLLKKENTNIRNMCIINVVNKHLNSFSFLLHNFLLLLELLQQLLKKKKDFLTSCLLH